MMSTAEHLLHRLDVVSTVQSSVARRAGQWLRRAAAALAAAAAGLHAASLREHTTPPMVGAMTIAMIVGCLYCARHLWMRGSNRDWVLVALMNVGMIAVHVSVMSPGTGGGSHHGQTQLAMVPTGHSMSTLMTIALAMAVLEAAIAVTVLFYKTRLDVSEVLP